MGSGLTVRDVFGEVRARGQRAWHGLGVELPKGKTAEEGFEELGINYGTELIPMQGVRVREGQPTEYIPDPNNFMHIRSDTGGVLGVVGPKYRPIRNIEMARFADALVGVDAKVDVETAGTLYGGRRVFCCVKLPKTIEVVDEDVLELYMVLSNAHDGSAAFHNYFTSVRIVCANTLAMSERDLSRGIRMQHTGSIEGKIEKARATLGLVVHETEKYEEEVRATARLELSRAQAREYFNVLYRKIFLRKSEQEAPDSAQMVDEDGDKTTVESKSTREKHQEKIVDRWMELFDDEKQTMKGIAGTAWAAYNAYSEWSDHERGNMRGIAESDVRVHSNLFGISALTKRKAWKETLALI